MVRLSYHEISRKTEPSGNHEQYGSRKFKGCQYSMFELMLILQTKLDYMNSISSVAKTCYNWIVLTILSLCLCGLGVPQPAVRSMIQTLACLKHHVWLFMTWTSSKDKKIGKHLQPESRPRQWCWPTHLGSSQHSSICQNVSRRSGCTI